MQYFQTPKRDQKLFIENVNFDTIAPQGSPVRVIDEMVDMLDTSEIESHYESKFNWGKNPIHPKTYLKIILFAMHNCRFSLRKIEEDLKCHMQYRWLSGDIRLDHSTFGKFLVRFTSEISRLFAQTVAICVQEELVSFDLLAIDSVKLRANANYKNSKTKKALNKSIAKIEKKITDLIETVDNEEKVQKQLSMLKFRKEKLEKAKSLLKNVISEKSLGKTPSEQKNIEKKEKINLTDNDAKIMQQANGEQNTAYSATVSVDETADIITHFHVNSENNDEKALLPAIEGSRRNAGKSHQTVLADPGFSSMENLEKLKEKQQHSLIPDKRFDVEKMEKTAKQEYDRSRFQYVKEQDVYQCPEGAELAFGSSVLAKGRTKKVYSNKKACLKCDKRSLCTKGKNRVIQRDLNEELKEAMRARLAEDVNKEKYKKRSHVAESPFGNIKENNQFRMLHRRGKEKVELEFALLFMKHNLLKYAKYAKNFKRN